MNKQIEFNTEARKKLLNGITKLSDAVVSTLGPYGRNVIIEKNGELPSSTKDGVSVAKSITLEDPIENMGAEIVKQAAIKSAAIAGDGTTTTTLLAHALISEGISKVEKGANATEIKREIDAAVKLVVAELKSMAEDITSEEQVKQIAFISSNNDEETGKLISQALEKVGREGVVTIEESKTGESYLEVVEGMQFDRGYKSPYFVTDNTSMQGILEDPNILIYDGIITDSKDIIAILENVSQKNESLLIVAEDIDGQALATLIVNKMRGTIKVAAVKAPDFGERRTLILEDLATLTGGTVVSKNKGMKLDKLPNIGNYLGKAGRATISKERTTIIDGKGEIAKIEIRAEEIKKQIEKPGNSMFENEKLQERLAKLTSGIAIVHVGGSNEIEVKEYKDRVEDALFASKAAIEEGILPGGGVALYHAREVLKDKTDAGSKIVYKALSKPFKQILINAGKEEIERFTYTLSAQTSPWIGYDLKTTSFINFKTAGIIDPLKVVRLALENSAAVAGTILITDCVIYTKPDPKKETEQNTDY